MFAALQGSNSDGHDFVEAAADRKASVALVRRGKRASWQGPSSRLAIVEVDDVEKALWTLARHVRRGFKGPVVAITGSVGKTTTKEMARALLDRCLGKGCATQGNMNNLLGTPLTILGLKPGDAYLLTELGSNAPGEIARLAKLVRPNAAIVTAVAAAHLEGFGSIEGVLAEKRQLPLSVGSKGFTVFFGQDEMLAKDAASWPGKKLTFGYDAEDTLRITSECDTLIHAIGHFEYGYQRESVCLPGPGVFNLRNAAAAVLLAVHLGMRFNEAAFRVGRDWTPAKMRMEKRTARGVDFLVDAYNANPSSMIMAADSLVNAARNSGRRSIAVLGAMLELGAQSGDLHKKVGRQVCEAGTDIIITVGKQWECFKRKGTRKRPVLHADGHEDAAKLLRDLCRERDVVLLKGSRGSHMEVVFDLFTQEENG